MLCSTTLDLRAHVRHEAESIEEAIALAERALELDAQSITYTATSGRGAGVVVSRETAERVQCVYTVICQRLEAEDPQRLVVQNRRLSENLRLHGEGSPVAAAGVFFIFIPADGTTVYLVVLHPRVIEQMLLQGQAGLEPWLQRTSRLELEVPEGRPWPEAVAAAGGKVIAYRRQEW